MQAIVNFMLDGSLSINIHDLMSGFQSCFLNRFIGRRRKFAENIPDSEFASFYCMTNHASAMHELSALNLNPVFLKIVLRDKGVLALPF